MTMTNDVMRNKGTRYVFAGTEGVSDEMPTKVCPRCGQELFADMDVCYGCLYDFSKDVTMVRGADAVPGSGERSRRPLPPQSSAHDPLAGIELDEPADEEVTEQVVPRHRREGSESAEDTLDLSELVMLGDVAEGDASLRASPTLAILVRTPELETRLPLGKDGLAFGRDRDNDVVLLSRSVSRHHLRVEPRPDGGALARDCGSTNPTELHGQPLSGEVARSVGDELSLCGTLLQLVIV